MWLALAQSPLSLVELCEAIVIEEGDSQIDDDSRIHPCEAILAICQGLVVHDEPTSRVSLAHSSVRNFLISEEIKTSPARFYSLDVSEASRSVIRKSLTYLLLDEFSCGYRSTKTLEAWKDSYPLLEFASLWPNLAGHRSFHHTIGPEELALVMQLLCTSTMDGGGNFRTWVSLLYHDPDHSMVQATQPLYCAASFGIEPAVLAILDQHPVDIDALGGRYASTALSAASYYGHAGVVKLLLSRGADPNIADGKGLPPLFWAQVRAHRDCADLLSSAGALEQVAHTEQVWVKPNTILMSKPSAAMAKLDKRRSRKRERNQIPVWHCSLCGEGARPWFRKNLFTQHLLKAHPGEDTQAIFERYVELEEPISYDDC
jgi:hypothetical protein